MKSSTMLYNHIYLVVIKCTNENRKKLSLKMNVYYMYLKILNFPMNLRNRSLNAAKKVKYLLKQK